MGEQLQKAWLFMAQSWHTYPWYFHVFPMIIELAMTIDRYWCEVMTMVDCCLLDMVLTVFDFPRIIQGKIWSCICSMKKSLRFTFNSSRHQGHVFNIFMSTHQPHQGGSPLGLSFGGESTRSITAHRQCS